jgi:hypothetical protein
VRAIRSWSTPIGLNDKTFVDNYRTPHGEKLHVTERWKLIDDGNMLKVNIRIEDPDTYFQPWSAIQRFRRAASEATIGDQAAVGVAVPDEQTAVPKRRNSGECVRWFSRP